MSPSPNPRTGPTQAQRRRRGPVAYVLGGLGAVATVRWLGLRVQPEPLRRPTVTAGDVATVGLPDGLPAPVARFYRALYGDRVPVVDSAVISGRGTMRIAGIAFPARFRFSHVTGRSYRHYIELTAFGARLTAVDEWFLDGHARLELPFGVSEGSNVDQGANLALWAECVWMPSVWVTDPRVRWEPIDATSARLIVPFGDERETLTVGFAARSGLLESLQSSRFKGGTDETRTDWRNEARRWERVDGHPVPLEAAITWGDEGSAWAELRTEQVIYNADLSGYIGAHGP